MPLPWPCPVLWPWTLVPVGDLGASTGAPATSAAVNQAVPVSRSSEWTGWVIWSLRLPHHPSQPGARVRLLQPPPPGPLPDVSSRSPWCAGLPRAGHSRGWATAPGCLRGQASGTVGPMWEGRRATTSRHGHTDSRAHGRAPAAGVLGWDSEPEVACSLAVTKQPVTPAEAHGGVEPQPLPSLHVWGQPGRKAG